MKKVYWNIIKPFMIPLLLGFGFLGLVIWLKPNIWVIWAFMAVITMFFVKFKDYPKNLLVNSAFLFGIYGLWRLIGVKGLLGLIIVAVIVSGIIIARKWKVFISTIREIEKIIWGRTNERRKKR